MKKTTHSPPHTQEKMASTFRRANERSLLNLIGTKPWAGGITLTSTGLRDLDNILGSGQPLGTCIWLEEDRWTQSLARTLIKYWCAEVLSFLFDPKTITKSGH